MSRPRGVLARALYDKYHNDAFIENYDMKLWYKLPNDGTDIYERQVYSLLFIQIKFNLIYIF